MHDRLNQWGGSYLISVGLMDNRNVDADTARLVVGQTSLMMRVRVNIIHNCLLVQKRRTRLQYMWDLFR